MIGDGWWSVGITVKHVDGRWGAEAHYYDDGFADDAPDIGRISTEGTVHTRYLLGPGALHAAVDVVRADAERLGIRWRDPHVYLAGEGEFGEVPEGWRDLVNAQSRRLGWQPAYGDGGR